MHTAGYVVFKQMNDPPLTSFQSVFYYLQAFPWQMIGIPMSIALMASLVGSITRPKTRGLPLLTFSFLLSVLLLSFSSSTFHGPMRPTAVIDEGSIFEVDRVERDAASTPYRRRTSEAPDPGSLERDIPIVCAFVELLIRLGVLEATPRDE